MQEKIILSPDNQKTLMLAANQQVEETAESSAKAIINGKIADEICYPPNGGPNPEEIEALNKIGEIPNVESALRKVIAYSTATAFFNFFCILDGVGDPDYEVGAWTWATLLDHPEGDYDPYDFMLHDAFYDAYWAWRNPRSEKGWALDNLPNDEAPGDVWNSYD
jgi:hypothetical protein